MNTLMLGLIMLFNGDGTATNTVDYSWVLEDMDTSIELLAELPVEENTIKIFDVKGNRIGQYDERLVIENKIPLNEIRKIQESEFLFEFQGDSYYLKD